MSIVLQGSTSGSITLQEPAVAGSTTINLPATTGTALVAPTALTVPNTTGTVMVSGNMPAFLAWAGADTSIPTATATKVLFSNETFDTNSNFASSRFTPTVAGYYVITASLGWSGSTPSGNLDMYIAKNGSASIPDIRNNVPYTGPVIMQGSYIWYLNGSTDYVEIFAYQGSGSTQTVITGQDRTWFAGYMVRAA